MAFSRFTQAACITLAVASISLIAGRSLVHAASGHPGITTPARETPSQATPSQTPTPHPPGDAPPPPPRTFPAPINLKVLPRNLTGEQVHDIMEKWEGELGSGCKTCHAVDPKNIGPNGKPRLNFADDSKEEKRTARVMYKMTEDINANYVSKIDSSGDPVSCGTCHRGHLGPEPFVPAPEKEHAH